MDPIKAAKFANMLGHFYQNIAKSLGDYLHGNISNMSKVDADVLADDITRITTYGNTFYSLSDAIAFSESDTYFQSIETATSKINAAVSTIDHINKAVKIAAAIITLGSAVVSKNGQSIAAALASLIGTGTSSTNSVAGST